MRWKVSHQQLDRCLAATVWAARHHSNMHHSLSPMAAWKPHQYSRACRETLTETEVQEHVYQKPVRDVDELKQHLIETWSATSRASLIKRLISGQIVLMRVSKPKANTEHLLHCFSVTVMTFKAYITAARPMNKLTYVLFHKVRWEQPSGEAGKFVANLLPYLCAKILPKYNVVWQTYCRNKMVQSFCPTVYINIATILLCAVLTRDNARQKLCGASVAQNHGQFFSRYFWHAASQRSKIQSLGHGVTPATVQLQGHVVESTDRFTYLGSDIHSSERSTPEILRSSFKYFQQTGQRLKADRIEFTDEDTALQCPCHLRTVIWLWDMDSPEGWRTAIRSVPREWVCEWVSSFLTAHQHKKAI